MRKIGVSVDRLEKRLSQSPWLAGENYTLADICNFAIANGMQHGFAEIVNRDATPHLVDWIERINARPAAQEMFAKSQSEMPSRAPAPTPASVA